jgi:hypothetical protein
MFPDSSVPTPPRYSILDLSNIRIPPLLLRTSTTIIMVFDGGHMGFPFYWRRPQYGTVAVSAIRLADILASTTSAHQIWDILPFPRILLRAHRP